MIISLMEVCLNKNSRLVTGSQDHQHQTNLQLTQLLKRHKMNL